MEQKRDPSLAAPAGEPRPEPAELDEEALSQVEGSPESDAGGEEFLFHLYRGSELLQDNCISEAKEELERALAMQPQDVEGQGLLGIVYFRLGLYPRAIKIYEEIVKACPGELTPRVNLALCYIKTGQLERARQELETVISRAPERTRAWGYLGLVFERMGDLHKARAAFEKAGQEHLVRRMDRLLSDEQLGSRDSDRAEHIEVRKAAADAVAELETAGGATSAFLGAMATEAGPRAGHWRAIELGEASIPPAGRAPLAGLFRDPSRPRKSLPPLSLSPPTTGGMPAPSSELEAAALLVFPTDGSVEKPSAGSLLVRVTEGFVVRQEAIGALVAEAPGFTSSPVMRRQRGHDTSEPMGGHTTPFVALDGSGHLLMATERCLEVLHLRGGFVYVKEGPLVGFESTVRHEHGRFSALGDEAVSMVQLSGRGLAVFERRGALKALGVRAEQPVVVRARLVLGWTGRLLSQPVEAKHAPNQAYGFVAFSGDGAIFLELFEDGR